jgi:FkbM family methyltransferase
VRDNFVVNVLKNMNKKWLIFDNINHQFFETDFEGVLEANEWHSYGLFYKENYGCEFSKTNSVYEMFDCIVEPNDIVVDLGANIGLFTNKIANTAKRVIAVEGAPEIFSCLVKNTCVEHKNIEYLNASIVSDKQIKEKNIWSYRPSKINVTLRQIFELYNLEKIDFLKVDIESAEYDIFYEGFDPELLSRINKISMEVHVDPNNSEGKELNSIINCLSNKTVNYFNWWMNGHLQRTLYFKSKI